jgi:preprotein translocase subunit SecD
MEKKKKIMWSFGLIGLALLLSVAYIIPSLPVHKTLPAWWQELMENKGMVLGLDLQGGTHLVYEVEGDKGVENAMERMVFEIRDALKEKKIEAQVTYSNKSIVISPPDEKAIARIEEIYQQTLTLSEKNEKSVSFTLQDQAEKNLKNTAIDQALEVIRNRIDQFGVSEPTIHKQGTNDIVVELPGVKDPKRAIALIGKTAILEFKLLDEKSPVVSELPSKVEVGEEEKLLEDFKSKIPEDAEILFQRVVEPQTAEVYKTPFLVKKQTLMTGDLLKEARKSIDTRYNEPIVEMTFNERGAELFEKITGEHVQERLAIVLDNNVYSAPVIKQKIGGGNAMIEGNFSDTEAKDLAIVLRAGSLPAPLKMIQNVTVGPSLGRDSIDAGIKAGIICAILVAGFMFFYYKLSGLIADFAMVLNIIFLLGVLSMFNATMTLPGIAGVILAIGMAVDTNVLMFERMREEVRAGKTPKAAVDSGYDKAWWTIVDSHVTTIITSVILYSFGTGPIKGFAVTLGVGVVINLFTSLIGTKAVFDYINLKRDVKTLSI